MTKREFLMQLNDALGCLTGDERSAAIKYYSDYIDDAGTENTAQVIAALGTPQEVADMIIKDAQFGGGAANPAPSMPPPRMQDVRNGLPAWVWVLILILLLPVWVPIIATLGGLLAGLVGVLVSIFVATGALVLSGGVLLVIGICGLVTEPPVGLLVIGIGMMTLGFGALLSMCCVFLCRTVIPALARGIASVCRSLFRRKGGVPR
ncbi:MAG: DUF1700 domain-containing protein [Pygmaiobacter sp.]